MFPMHFFFLMKRFRLILVITTIREYKRAQCDKSLLLLRFALRKFHLIEGVNARDHITRHQPFWLYASNSLPSDVQTAAWAHA